MVTEFGMSEKLGSVRYAGQRLSAELLKAESLDGSAVRAVLSSADHAVASGTPKSVFAA
jgi:hypothetical protein